MRKLMAAIAAVLVATAVSSSAIASDRGRGRVEGAFAMHLADHLLLSRQQPTYVAPQYSGGYRPGGQVIYVERAYVPPQVIIIERPQAAPAPSTTGQDCVVISGARYCRTY